MLSVENRDYVMLAKTYSKHNVPRWYLSQKWDGKRCLWDGGVTRGHIVRDIPWANKGNVDRIVGRATGLWSRYGNVICAPDWFLDDLPKGIMLDGELWMAPKQLQSTLSIVQSFVPDARWRAISYLVFDNPSYTEFCRAGRINANNLKMIVDQKAWHAYLKANGIDIADEQVKPFQVIYKELVARAKDFAPHVQLVQQTQLPHTGVVDCIFENLRHILERRGEGCMLRQPFSYWLPKRGTSLLKVKPAHDDEAVVVGYKAGDGRHLGRLGALTVEWKGVTFDIGTGFSDLERAVEDRYVVMFKQLTGKPLPVSFNLPTFPKGCKVTFHYNGLYDSGIPREGSFIRKYEET